MDNKNSNLGTQKLSLDNFEKASEPQPGVKPQPHHYIVLSREQISDLKQHLSEVILKILDYGNTG
jgi:hypothetical protein